MAVDRSPVCVLYVSSVAGVGGAECSLLELVTHLDRTRFTPLLLVSQDGLLAEKARAAGIETVYGDFPFFSKRRPWVYLKSIWHTTSLVRRYGVSLVHVNCDRAVPHAVTAAKLARVRCLCHIHDMIRAWYQPNYVRYLNWSNGVIADSQATARACKIAGVGDEKVKVIYECFDMERYAHTDIIERQCFRREFEIQDDEIAVGLVGHLIPYKGHEEFVRAAQIVAGQCSLVRFFVVGDDEMSCDKEFLVGLRQFVARSGLSDRVVFTGHRSDVPLVMSGLDVIAVPSHTEAFGRVVVEALASRRPVVASDVGGIPEIIEHGVTGFLTPPKDAEALAQNLLRLCRDPELRVRMGRNGPEVAARFDVHDHAGQFQNLYTDVLDNRGELVNLTSVDCET